MDALRISRIGWLWMWVLITSIALPGFGQSILYVDSTATGANDGSSWVDAYVDLQDALNNAVSGDEIWVAAGTYYPTSDYGLAIGDRGKHFRMINGVAIYGGFDGTETALELRDVQSNETILSGNIGVLDDPNDNCYHVFYHPDGLAIDPNAILDGFTITAGNAHDYPHTSGGGMYNDHSSPTLTNCIFSDNSAEQGGGMFNEWSSPTLTGCTFNGNSSEMIGGGGMHNSGSNPVLTGCIFTENSTGEYGGGINNEGGSLTLTDCIFSRNFAGYGGGGMCNGRTSLTVTSCIFKGNTVLNESIINRTGGAILMVGLGSQTRPPAGNDYVAIAAGHNHSLALKTDGSIVGWGHDSHSQATPPADNNYAAIAAGGSHSLALKTDGSIVGWGYDDDGQATPPAGNDYVAIAAGNDHSLALKTDGSIVGWGNDEFDQASPPAGNDYVAIAAGYSRSLALKTDGSIEPIYDKFYGDWDVPPPNTDFTTIDAGLTGFGLKTDGSIVGWGTDSFGLISDIPTGNDYVALAAGFFHSLALKTDGSIVGWGYDDDGRATPPTGNDYLAIAAGFSHNLALKADCSIVGWPNYNLTLSNCTISDNIPDGVWMEHCDAQIEGTVEIASNDWIGNDVMLTGSGILQIDSNTVLDLDDSHIRCDLFGTGTLKVDLGTDLIIEGDATVNLAHETDPNLNGTIQCDGLLRVKDNVQLRSRKTITYRIAVSDSHWFGNIS